MTHCACFYTYKCALHITLFNILLLLNVLSVILAVIVCFCSLLTEYAHININKTKIPIREY